MPNQCDIGLIGLAVMGENLALNIESRGFSIAVYNRTVSKVDDLLAGRAKGKNFVGCHSLEELVASLAAPRKVMLMVKAGPAVDEFIEKLIPLLEPGDVIIDGGNTHFSETERRTKYVESKGLLYVGTGVSGGEEGALKGPSMMPGGSEKAWPLVKPIFQAIAAKVGPGGDVPCCEWVGPRGAGHYVKMVHNGIEYGDMQLICEAYWMLKNAAGLTNDELYDVFQQWYEGELNSYLIEITRDIFSVRDDLSDGYLVDMILDTAGAKGTGKWMSQLALDLGVPSTLVTEAVYARCLSAMKDARVRASKVLKGPTAKFRGDRVKFIEQVRQSLYASKICSYAQGYVQIQAAAKEHDWPLKFGEIAMLWRGGCIIRAVFLERIKEAFDAKKPPENLLLAPYFKKAVRKAQTAWRNVVTTAVRLGIPVPALSSALAYYDGYRSERLPANLLQAQRDYFGAHTYNRVDREGVFHSDWLRLRKEP
ncbi:MAG: NADP-dependent phosphogluconate dehydrogenase [Planctomycetes bacterium]|nr:NADP-dependent phosphogluconate dehydrogenase [Planctomycetota bacterium]MBU4399889.1 NADP-dependent phosphogluconate dehydrogenase [Planctomycetota bacterium]MCG2683042.1 NADP-dependent phosphogluconate dehydrogenase [Planctomycetales bacterium]